LQTDRAAQCLWKQLFSVQKFLVKTNCEAKK